MGSRNQIRLRESGGRAWRAADVSQAELARLIGDPEAVLWKYLDRPVKISHTSLMVRAELTIEGEVVSVAYKQFRPRNWWKSLCWWFRRSPARKCWTIGRLLNTNRIATPRPLAVLEPGGSWFCRRAYLVTEWIAGAENLHLYGWRLTAQPIHRRLRSAARCAESLGRLVGRMHARRIVNRDLKGANLLVVESGSRTETFLVDVAGVRLARRLSRRRRAGDLARLAAGLEAHPWVTRSICARFLRAYAGQLPAGTIDRKRLWREVAARSRRIVEYKRRRRQQVL